MAKKKITLESLDKKLDRVIDVLVTKADTGRIDELEKRIDKRFEQKKIDGLLKVISEQQKEESKKLINLTPQTYVGVAEKLATYEEK